MQSGSAQQGFNKNAVDLANSGYTVREKPDYIPHRSAPCGARGGFTAASVVNFYYGNNNTKKHTSQTCLISLQDWCSARIGTPFCAGSYFTSPSWKSTAENSFSHVPMVTQEFCRFSALNKCSKKVTEISELQLQWRDLSNVHTFLYYLFLSIPNICSMDGPSYSRIEAKSDFCPM